MAPRAVSGGGVAVLGPSDSVRTPRLPPTRPLREPSAAPQRAAARAACLSIALSRNCCPRWGGSKLQPITPQAHLAKWTWIELSTMHCLAGSLQAPCRPGWETSYAWRDGPWACQTEGRNQSVTRILIRNCFTTATLPFAELACPKATTLPRAAYGSNAAGHGHASPGRSSCCAGFHGLYEVPEGRGCRHHW